MAPRGFPLSDLVRNQALALSNNCTLPRFLLVYAIVPGFLLTSNQGIALLHSL